MATLRSSSTPRKAARALATSVRANLAMGDALDDADEALVHAAAEVASGPGGERAEAAYWSGPRLPQQHKTGRKVLLHSCCAPCSGAMVEAMVGAGHDVTIFFYNPNIHPRKEYEIRKQENKRYAQHSIDTVDLDGDVVGGIDVDEWYARKGMEFCPNAGRAARCASTCASSGRRSMPSRTGLTRSRPPTPRAVGRTRRR